MLGCSGCWVCWPCCPLPDHKCLQLFLHGMQGGTTAAGKNLKPNIATTTATSRQAAPPAIYLSPLPLSLLALLSLPCQQLSPQAVSCKWRNSSCRPVVFSCLELQTRAQTLSWRFKLIEVFLKLNPLLRLVSNNQAENNMQSIFWIKIQSTESRRFNSVIYNEFLSVHLSYDRWNFKMGSSSCSSVDLTAMKWQKANRSLGAT